MPDLRRRPVVAWDGEGANLPDGSHAYVLLGSSVGGRITDPEGISTEACFRFLLAESQRAPKDALHVIYGMGYDVNMMLRDLPRWALDTLWTSERGHVRWGPWGVFYRPNRMFSVTLYDGHDHKARKLQRFTLVDAIGFHQAPFVKVAREWLPAGDERVPLIEDGKAARGSFDADPTGYVERYMSAELSALVDVETRFMGLLDRLGLELTQHNGAGSLAASLLDAHGVKEALPDAELSAAMRSAASHAYFGGRIELVRFGRATGLYAHDLRSAYPSSMVGLPDARAGSWRYRVGPVSEPQAFALYRVRWSLTPAPFHPFPFRELTGAVKFPPEGEAWVWGVELIEALQHASPGDRIDVLESWTLKEADREPRPFAWVADRYRQRADLKAAGDPAQLPLKLALNSLYGKLAQRLGYQRGSGRLPPYHSLVYAGYITADTRARLYNAAMRAGPESVVFFATDGLVTTAPAPVREGTELGAWEVGTVDELIAVQSGVYFYRDGTDWTHKYRGWGKGVLDPDGIVSSWERGHLELTVPVTRFVGMGRALAGIDAWDAWRTWRTEPRRLQLHPCAATGKRRAVSRVPYRTLRARGPHPARGLVPTVPRQAFGSVSEPSRSPWDDELRERIVRDAAHGEAWDADA